MWNFFGNHFESVAQTVGQHIVAETCSTVVLMSESMLLMTGLLLCCSLLYPDLFLTGLRGQHFYRSYIVWLNMK